MRYYLYKGIHNRFFKDFNFLTVLSKVLIHNCNLKSIWSDIVQKFDQKSELQSNFALLKKWWII